MGKIFFTSIFALLALYGNGQITSSTFLPHLDFKTPKNGGPEAAAVGDLNGDNKPEIAVVDFNGVGLSIFKNSCKSGKMDSTSFALRQDFTVAPNAGMVRLADMDGDLKLDVVVA